jgi:Tol biopolymer transport system component
MNSTEVAFSPDHQWMLSTNWTQLWRSRPDGSDRLQLAGAPSIPNIYFARWSPDSKHIVFETLRDGDKGTIYVVSVAGGAPQELLPPGPSRRWPDWSPDGRTISFTVEDELVGIPHSESCTYLFDLNLRKSAPLPNSCGLILVRWSPDGRFLAAVTTDFSTMKLLDLDTRRWTEVAHGTLISLPVWSPDSVLYFQDLLAPGEPVYRFQSGTSAPRRVYSFEDFLQAGAVRCGFWGFAPDGSLVVQVNRGGGDIYALSVSH